MVGYALGSRRSAKIIGTSTISEVGAILTESDWKTLYEKVMVSGLTDAQMTARIEQIVDSTVATTDPNVILLREWYSSVDNSNKIFANKLIAATLSSSTTSSARSSTVSSPS